MACIYGEIKLTYLLTYLQLWKECKNGYCKEPYLQAKKDSKRTVCLAKKAAEEERFKNINRNDSRKEVFKIAKQMKAENCDVVDDKCVKNNAENDAY